MRLLVIEDDPALQATVASILREEDYAVDVASDGEEGLFKAQATAYDAIILDVLMPKLDGWGVLQQLRQTSRVPVLMLTALDDTRNRVKGLDRGADDYLPKPFDLEELLARIRALIRRSAGQPSPVLRLGELTLDTAARRVELAGTEVPLTAREYSLLEYLALHRGQVVSRTELYEHLFDEDDDSLSNLLDVHVSNLRKKLGRDLIETRRGLGYCLP
ncbi:response regulator transcription factor [Opitutus sp. ER46]|uniref:response regulator transcription factor n=1 Tax=Opitutus sp. ER46 TaxID=2161864 RepID=UPI000D327DEA|nr:response regulator transcription factor [Opitutus sp. ER46]PTX96504.1 DNA-binding response regulator [Opitutus sp. ER46]